MLEGMMHVSARFDARSDVQFAQTRVMLRFGAREPTATSPPLGWLWRWPGALVECGHFELLHHGRTMTSGDSVFSQSLSVDPTAAEAHPSREGGERLFSPLPELIRAPPACGGRGWRFILPMLLYAWLDAPDWGHARRHSDVQRPA